MQRVARQVTSHPDVGPHPNHLAVRVIAQGHGLSGNKGHSPVRGLVIMARCDVAGSDCPVSRIVHWYNIPPKRPPVKRFFFGKLAREPQQLPRQVTNLLRKIVTRILVAFVIRWYFDYLTFSKRKRSERKQKKLATLLLF